MICCLMGARGGRALLFIVAAGLVASGCRSYGGQGAEEALFRQMEVAHQVFEDELVRARADLVRLEAAASESDVAAVLATQYEQVVRGHEAVLDHHANLIAERTEDSGYRGLHRAFGAIIAQQRTIRMQYGGALEGARLAVQREDTTSTIERPYSFIPPYYKKVSAQQRDLSVNEWLAEMRSSGAPSAGLSDLLPDESAEDGGTGNVQESADGGEEGTDADGGEEGTDADGGGQ